MKEVFHTETTTDGRTLLYCSTGQGTSDVEVIEFSKNATLKDCDCPVSVELTDPNIEC